MAVLKTDTDGTIIICGSTCGHNHESPNGPTGCCAKHGPYMYFCADCHAERTKN